ncbi:ATP synthase F1 subunit epsilon [Salibacteraceae bacterium]|jgi:F-type H+-transporting ATPase subunit epsilon|nr:ATP synthase F1 subunit epsilon [Salibacteraceae bacterium]HAQ70013.1 ATP synthase F1 subunit epsilon [Flavobacteriales bacterium]MDA9267576.1 ATP synthase F1 subunit epsilon [Salibacteraceae bacterium]MDB0002481.1 ATP synthase F1 subunit epsilon [Salibacteraceae bacterium]MDB4105498.1 ATP synthase F1 subunit epsilon [Salibacteraceae bacterium]
MTLEILSPEKLIFKGVAESIQLPGKDGSFGILENHAPIIATLKKGVVKVSNEGQETEFEIKGGVVEVVKNKVIVLSD